MKIKVCGLKDEANITAVAALQPDYMGFIFYSKSARYAIDMPVESLTNASPGIIKTGVFVNETAGCINELIARYGFNAIQLHGGESPEFCAAFLGSVTVLKAFGIDESFDFDSLIPYQHAVDYFLFDTKTPIHGGSGKTFDWGMLNQYHLNVPFFLSGGLSPDNLAEVKNIEHQQFYGVDLNSRFEISPGIKDLEKLNAAFELLRHTNYEIRS